MDQNCEGDISVSTAQSGSEMILVMTTLFHITKFIFHRTILHFCCMRTAVFTASRTPNYEIARETLLISVDIMTKISDYDLRQCIK